MLEAVGDLWKYPADYRVITTNGCVGYGNSLIMGAGIALQAKKRFPALPHKLGKWVKQYGNRVFICHDYRIISFPTKHSWKQKSDLSLIEASARQLVQVVDKFTIGSVVLPRPGCLNGGLTWDMVRPVIASILDDRFICVERP